LTDKAQERLETAVALVWGSSAELEERLSQTYPDVIFQLDSSRGIELNLLQGLADDIVGLALARLRGLDGGSLVNVALVVDIELAEGVGKGEDLILLELRKLPVKRSAPIASRACAGSGHCRGEACGSWSYLWSLRTFMMARIRRAVARVV
jgi:hypothetical protein